MRLEAGSFKSIFVWFELYPKTAHFFSVVKFRRGRMKGADYKYIATSRTGFVQQVVSSYVARGYRFHVSGQVPSGKDPRDIDEKLLDLYDIRKTKSQRYRAKQAGKANLQYIRFERDWLMLGTHGKHPWKELEAGNIKDCRRDEPIYFRGYSIRLKAGLYRPYRCRNDKAVAERDDKLRVRVQIARDTFRALKADFLNVCKKRRPDWLASKFYNLPYEPYAPVRQQLLSLLFHVNQTLKKSGRKSISTDVIRLMRKQVLPFN